MLVAGFTLAELVIRRNLMGPAVKVTAAVLWFSAMMILASSFAIVDVQGGGRKAATAANGIDVQRFFTATQTLAFAVLIFVIVFSVCVRTRVQEWLMLGLPALVVTFFRSPDFHSSLLLWQCLPRTRQP